MAWYGGSIVGAAHRARGMPSQDAWQAVRRRDNELVAVSDGLGAKPHGGESARALCWAAKTSDRLCGPGTPVPEFLTLVDALYATRTAALPAGSTGATGLLSRITASTWLVAQVGDGLVAEVSRDGSVSPLATRDGWLNSTQVVGGTAWTCRELDRAETRAVVLATDGIADDIEAGRLEDFCRILLDTCDALPRTARSRKVVTELRRWPTPSSNDDKTLVVHLP